MFSCELCEAEFLFHDDLRAHRCEDFFVADTQEESFISIDVGSLLENSQRAEETAEEKSHAVWTRAATLALLALYEAKMNMLDNVKQRGKIWMEISTELRLSYGIEMTHHQVRWKFNALNKRYKETKDNNARSGRGNQEFEWFNAMDQIFDKDNVCSMKRHTVSSKPLPKREKSVPSTSKSSATMMETTDSDRSSQTSKNDTTPTQPFKGKSIDGNVNQSKVQRPLHGTGSKVAKTKIELEKQWLHHLKMTEERDKKKEETNNSLLEMKKDAIRLKKKQQALKQKEIEERRLIANKKLKEKQSFNARFLHNENLKYKVLNKCTSNKENKEDVELSSSSEDL